MKQTKTIQQKLGKEGEKLALHFLEEQGLTILETNWRTGHIEIDIIAHSKSELIIIEVKTRGTDYFGQPESAVSRKKEFLMASGAEEYLFQNELDKKVRFDIIAIVLNDEKLEIEHFPDAFFPGVY